MGLPASMRIPICRLPEDGEDPGDGGSLIWIDGIVCHEIGEVVKTPAELDDAGDVITEAETIPGYQATIRMIAVQIRPRTMPGLPSWSR